MRDLLNLFLESKIPCKPTHLSHVLASLLVTFKRFRSRTSLYKTQIVSSPVYFIYVCICSNQYLYFKWICQLYHASWAVLEVLALGEFPRGGLPSTSEGQPVGPWRAASSREPTASSAASATGREPSPRKAFSHQIFKLCESLLLYSCFSPFSSNNKKTEGLKRWASVRPDTHSHFLYFLLTQV